MRVLITGSKGQLGGVLVSMLQKRGVETVGVDLDELDIARESAVYEMINRIHPTHVINCAAYNAVDKAEDEPKVAFAINSLAPAFIAIASNEIGAKFVHYSSDYVFDGEKDDDYLEDDSPHPISIYGRSKLAGEQAVLAIHPESYLLRTAWVFAPGGNNFVSRLIKRMEQPGPLKFIDDQLGTPTYAEDLARVTLELIDKGAPFGLYHAVGSEACSPFDWAKRVVGLVDPGRVVEPIPGSTFKTKAPRPRRSVLANRKLNELGIEIKSGLARVKDYLTR